MTLKQISSHSLAIALSILLCNLPQSFAAQTAVTSPQATADQNSPSQTAATSDQAPSAQNAQPAPRPIQASSPTGGASNGRKAADFVSEDDVKRAIQKGEKIYVGPKTIITPSARDIGEPAEVFAKA